MDQEQVQEVEDLEEGPTGTGRQLLQMLPYLAEHGVQMWLPEFDGPVRSDDPTHEAVMLLLGSQSRRVVTRSRFRVLAAMRTRVLEQGRFQGGRPPYGYLLVDAGPHPNLVHAQWGRRVHRLEPDPVTALNVRWIFAQRLAGRGLAAVGRNLNDAGLSSPSGAVPDRNRHRGGGPWTVQTVASILANPQYTGRQVWNRQGRGRPDPAAGELGDRRWNPGGEWIFFPYLAHPGLVSERDFLAAQTIDANPGTPVPGRCYALAGLVIYSVCGRHLESHWSHGQPGYRCRHGHTSARTKRAGHPVNVYAWEDRVVEMVVAHLMGLEGTQVNAFTTNAGHVAEVLRATEHVIVCDRATATIRTAQPANHSTSVLIRTVEAHTARP